MLGRWRSLLGRQETGYVGSSACRGNMSLIRLISSLPALQTLKLHKLPAHPGGPGMVLSPELPVSICVKQKCGGVTLETL